MNLVLCGDLCDLGGLLKKDLQFVNDK
jgi:hypothetical protein